MDQKLSINFMKITDQDDMAFILEVIAGEIRHGRVCGEEKEFSWATGHPGYRETVLQATREKGTDS